MGVGARMPRSWGADVVRKERERLGLSRAALSISSGVCESTIAKLEQGRHTVSLRIAVRLSRALRLPCPAPGPALAIPLAGTDPATAARIVRQALQEFVADRIDPHRYCDRLGPWTSVVDYTVQLCATQADAETAAALAAGIDNV